MSLSKFNSRAVVALAASAGGFHVVSRILSHLSASFPAPLLVVQHRANDPLVSLTRALSIRTRLRVRDCVAGEALEPGTVYVAPPDQHVSIGSDHRLALEAGAKINHVGSAADPLFSSMARVFGARALGVVLTGHGRDGAAGAKAIRRSGGLVIVQEPASCLAASMPNAVLAACGADFVLRPGTIADALVSLIEAPSVSAALFGLRPVEAAA